MAAGVGLFMVVLVLAIVAPLILYYFIRAEHEQRETMDRAEAEQAARRDRNE